MKRKILVCGATGFIGRNLAEAMLGDGDFELHAVHNKRRPFEDKRIIWHQCDLVDASQVEMLIDRVRPAWIIQAAATTSGAKDIVATPEIHVTDNVVMNSYLFRAAVKFNVDHVIFFSCTVMYTSSEVSLTEADFDANKPVHPRYFGVANTKLYLEKMCEFFSGLGTTKFTAIRHSNIYGPHDKFDLDRSHFFGATITKVLTASDSVTVWGSGEEERDLLFVSDLVDFVKKVFLFQNAQYKMFHCGSGYSQSVKSVVERIIEVSGRTVVIKHDLAKPSIKTSLSLDCSLAKKELGWSPKISLDQGIKLTIDWWLDNVSERSSVPTLTRKEK